MMTDCDEHNEALRQMEPTTFHLMSCPCLIQTQTQEPSLGVFVKKMVQRCGVWQIKPMTSLDQDP